MTILEQIDKATTEALKAGDRDRVTVLRGLKSDIKYAQIEHRENFGDPETIAVLSTCAKQRRDSIEQYAAGKRQDLVDKETRELAIITEFLPQQLSEDELREIVAAAIREVNAGSPKDMGKIMQVVMPKIKGRADGKMVNKLVMEILAN
jgi:hypothetical protein